MRVEQETTTYDNQLDEDCLNYYGDVHPLEINIPLPNKDGARKFISRKCTRALKTTGMHANQKRQLLQAAIGQLVVANRCFHGQAEKDIKLLRNRYERTKSKYPPDMYEEVDWGRYIPEKVIQIHHEIINARGNPYPNLAKSSITTQPYNSEPVFCGFFETGKDNTSLLSQLFFFLTAKEGITICYPRSENNMVPFENMLSLRESALTYEQLLTYYYEKGYQGSLARKNEYQIVIATGLKDNEEIVSVSFIPRKDIYPQIRQRVDTGLVKVTHYLQATALVLNWQGQEKTYQELSQFFKDKAAERFNNT